MNHISWMRIARIKYSKCAFCRVSMIVSSSLTLIATTAIPRKSITMTNNFFIGMIIHIFSTVHPSLRAAAFALWRRSNPLLTRRLLRAKEHRPRNDEIYSCLYGRENHTIIFFSILKAVFYFRVGNDRDSESIIGSV